LPQLLGVATLGHDKDSGGLDGGQLLQNLIDFQEVCGACYHEFELVIEVVEELGKYGNLDAELIVSRCPIWSG
jgi:hypothetical protein